MSRIKINSLDFCQIFEEKQQPCIIAEIKFSSPSKGRIYNGNLNHIDIATSYLDHGASAISVLTEPHYFEGNIQYIQDIRKKFPQAHLLLKDFVLHQEQIIQGLRHGANAILLIVAFLNKTQLSALYYFALNLGLCPIIEVHDLPELEIALKLDPKIIGINNRDLKTLQINLNTSKKLINHIPENIYTICESGIEYFNQIKEMQSLGFNGFLIGSGLMKHRNPGKALKTIISGDCHAH